ncbi:MAG TPA: protein kinase [Acidimicrobiales bacterium]|nr:protein kinase [Acidimicrobiales bacterium]
MAGVAPGVPRALAGRYRLVRLLARGGMAEVWEGRDDVLSRPVAVKMLLSHLAADPMLRERFRREAVTAARLVHPGIVAIFDAGVEAIGDDGASPGTLLSSGWARDEQQRIEMAWPDQPSTAFIVMELVPGETLRDLMLRSGPLPAGLALEITSQVTDALAHAHAHGLVHRDIKPANVLLRDEGGGIFRVKVADFGIAKAAALSGDLTANGTFLGTPKYVSPEQVQGQEPDGRADIYSLGVVLFEMLAGEPPFHENTDIATALAHVQKPPPSVGDLRPSLPDGLGDLVASMLVKEPAQRIGSALALGGALNNIRKRMGSPAADPGGELHLSIERRPVGTAATVQPSSNGKSPSPGAQAHVAPPSSRPSDSGAPVVSGPRTSGGTLALPSDEQRRPAALGPARPRHRSGRITAVVVVSMLLAGSAVALTVFRHGPDANKGRSAGQSGGDNAVPSTAPLPAKGKYPALSVTDVYELAQRGNHADDDLGGLGNVVSDNQSAYWESAKYDGPDFGGFDGLGLVLRLAGTGVLHELEVTTPMHGWSAEAFVASSYAKTLAGWGAPTAELTSVAGNQTMSLGDKKGSWVLFWMLNPGPTDQAVVDKLSVH